MRVCCPGFRSHLGQAVLSVASMLRVGCLAMIYGPWRVTSLPPTHTHTHPLLPKQVGASCSLTRKSKYRYLLYTSRSTHPIPPLEVICCEPRSPEVACCGTLLLWHKTQTLDSY